MIDFIDPTMVPFVASFLFVFAIIFGLLAYTKMFNNKGVNAVIAAVFGIFAVMYDPFVVALEEFMPFGTIILVIAFFLMFLKKLFFSKGGKIDAWPLGVSVAIGLILLMTLWSKIGFSVFGMTSNEVLWIMGLIGIVVIFILAYTQHSGPPAGSGGPPSG